MENAKEVVVEFKERMNVEVRRQEKFDLAKEEDFRRVESPRKYIAQILYR